MQVQMTIGDLRRILSQIGTGHDAKPLAVMVSNKVIAIDANDVAVQGDRVLFCGMAIPRQPKVTREMSAGLGWK